MYGGLWGKETPMDEQAAGYTEAADGGIFSMGWLEALCAASRRMNREAARQRGECVACLGQASRWNGCRFVACRACNGTGKAEQEAPDAT